MPGKVSIIMPAYNSGRYIGQAIASVQNQTYSDWELIIVDDCSSDNTFGIINELSCTDSRITVLKNKTNSGAAASRNRAIEAANGKYIAFLDSDDIWLPAKLEKQISLMESNHYLFTCTSYNKIDESSCDLGVVIKALNIDYYGLLLRCPGNSTVIYNCAELGKFYVPLIRKRNDYLMWFQVIKEAKFIHGFDEVLSSHRIGMQSISSNKKDLVKYHWMIYHDIEKQSIIKSAYLCCFWIAKSILGFQ